MPIYDYACEACGHVVEVVHAISASGPTTCEVCGGRMKRALSVPAIVFKGSGWAKKDARDAVRARPAAATAGDGPDKGAPEATSAGAGDKGDATDTGAKGDKVGAGDKAAAGTPSTNGATGAGAASPATTSTAATPAGPSGGSGASG